MLDLSAEDFYELESDGEVRRWSRIHWGDKQRGTLKFCVPVEPYRDCPLFATPPSDYPQSAAERFNAFLGQSTSFQLLAPAMAGTLASLLAQVPETSGLAVGLRRTPELGGGMAAIEVELSRNGVLVAKAAIRKPGITIDGEPDPPNLRYAQGLELADWVFPGNAESFSGRPFRGVEALSGGQSTWQDLLLDRFVLELLELL